MATGKILHICYIEATYRIDKRGRKWLQATNVTPGQKAYRDPILINDISQDWQPGEEHFLLARHEDTITPYGHNVKLVPVTEDEFKVGTRLSELASLVQAQVRRASSPVFPV